VWGYDVTKSRASIASRLLAFLTKRRIEYCVVGDVRRLPAEIDSDIDIVIDPRSLRHLPADLLDFCVGNELQIVQCLRHEVDAYYFVVSWPDEHGRSNFLQLDFCGDYCRDGACFLTAKELLGGRIEALASNGTPKGFYVPSPPRAFVYYLLKRIDKQSLDGRHGAFLNAEWRRNPLAAFGEVQRFWTVRHARLIGDAAETGCWSAVRAELPELRRALRTRVRRPYHSRLSELARKARRVLQPTGVFVAFVGPDGSGKSTLAEVVMQDLAAAFRRTGSFHFRPNLGRHPSADQVVTDPHGEIPRGPAGSVAKAAYYLCDYVFGYLWQVRPQLVRSTLLVFDRYSVDFEVDPKRFRYAGPGSIPRLVRRLAPRPDLVILLDAPADVLWARKPELPRDEFSRIAELYRRVVSSLPNGHVIDATQPIHEVAASVEAMVLAHMAARTRQRMGARHGDILPRAVAGASVR